MGLIPKEVKDLMKRLPEFELGLKQSSEDIAYVKNKIDMIEDMISVMFIIHTSKNPEYLQDETVNKLVKKISDKVN
jgi:hypothetical protein